MTNLYESDDFNIISVHKVPYLEQFSDIIEYGLYHVVIQRHPLDEYPEATHMSFEIDSVGRDLSLADFITAIVPHINTRLVEYDNEPNPVTEPIDTTTYSQIFT